MRLLACPDKFRGTLTASAAADAMAVGAARAGWDVLRQPLADGGEGTLAAFGDANRRSAVTGPLGKQVEAAWRLDRDFAVIEMAEASGLALVGGSDGNDPLEASTVGTGELIARAIEAGAKRIVVGAGGSATTDGGLGALRALHGAVLPSGIKMEVACDVEIRFVDAATVFGPQKGASAAQILLLTTRLGCLAGRYQADYGIDVTILPHSGAAGGLAGGLAALGASLHSGFEVVAEAVELYDQVEVADLVVTGEGQLDATSFDGKVVGGVLAAAVAAGSPALIVAGRVKAGTRSPAPVIDLSERFGLDRAMGDPAACIADALSDWLSTKQPS